MGIRISGSIVFLLFTVPLAAQAPPVFSGEVVVTATGEEQPVEETAAATTVLGRAEIAESGQADVAELLRRIEGTSLLRSGGGIASLFVRGAAGRQSLVLLDGVRLNSPLFGGYDWSLPATAGVERIEVVRGPFSALYGADAVGGVIQLVSRHPDETGARAVLEAGGGSWRRADLEAALVPAGPLAASVSLSSRAGSGEHANDDFEASTGLLKLDWRGARGAGAGLLLRAVRSRSEVPFSGALLTPERSTESDETMAAVPLRLRVGAGELELVLSYVDLALRFRDPDDPFGFTRGDTDAASAASRLQWRGKAGRHLLSAGLEWRRDEVTDSSSYGVALDGETIETASVFAQDRLRLSERLEVIVGARLDRADPWGAELSPRATLSYNGDGFRAWTAWGRAFRAPSLGELYYPFAGNAELEAERARSAEVGVSLPALRGLLTLVAFSGRIDSMIDYDYARNRYGNIARAENDGAELSLAAPLSARTSGRLSATWLDARDAAGQPLLRRPTWSASAVVSSDLTADLRVELSGTWVGERTDLDPVSYATVDQPGFLTGAVAARLELSRAFALRARVENVADRDYEEVRGYPAPGRRFFAGVETVLR